MQPSISVGPVTYIYAVQQQLSSSREKHQTLSDSTGVLVRTGLALAVQISAAHTERQLCIVLCFTAAAFFRLSLLVCLLEPFPLIEEDVYTTYSSNHLSIYWGLAGEILVEYGSGDFLFKVGLRGQFASTFLQDRLRVRVIICDIVWNIC